MDSSRHAWRRTTTNVVEDGTDAMSIVEQSARGRVSGQAEGGRTTHGGTVADDVDTKKCSRRRTSAPFCRMDPTLTRQT